MSHSSMVVLDAFNGQFERMTHGIETSRLGSVRASRRVRLPRVHKPLGWQQRGSGAKGYHFDVAMAQSCTSRLVDAKQAVG
jgi:hypothetical protein